MRPAALLVLLASGLSAQWPTIALHQVASGFGAPTGIAEVPDGSGRIFVLAQSGVVQVVKNGTVQPNAFLTIPANRIRSGGERGLLGIAFPPGFPSKQYLYLNYTDISGASVVSRWRVDPANADRALPDSEEIILRIPRNRANHNGGGIVFGPDGYLYIGTGDSGGSGDPDNAAQNPNELRGKMLRIDTESGQTPYGIPPGNPFVNRQEYRPEIWAMGLRNPWRYSFDRQTGDLWIADVGQNRAEEINFQPASSTGGENYGWDRMEGLECYPPGSSCDRSGLTLPIHEYGRTQGTSVTGGFVYRGTRYPALQGIYIYGDYGSGRIWGIRRTADGWENRELLQAPFEISAFGEDQAGELYVVRYGTGQIHLITAGAPSISANSVVNAASFAPGIAPGSLATVFGTGLTAFNGIVQATSFPVPTDLARTSVTLSGERVPVLAVAKVNGMEQINFQVPFSMAGRERVALQVNANGGTSNTVEVPLVLAQPEIFAITRSGNTITIWATGLGQVSGAPAAGQPAPSDPLSRVSAPTTVTVGGSDAAVAFSGLAPGFAGLYQVNATLPQAAAAGAGVVLRVGNAVSRPFGLTE